MTQLKLKGDNIFDAQNMKMCNGVGVSIVSLAFLFGLYDYLSFARVSY